MFERVSEVAEGLATGMSRRSFLGSFGSWAGATALAMAGVLNVISSAQAGSGNKTCCQCCGFVSVITGCVNPSDPCPPCPGGSFPCNFAVTGCGGRECKV
jgi:hypothetical protein